MSTCINELKKTLGLGARGNKYKVEMTSPTGSVDGRKLTTLCKGGSIPEITMGAIDVHCGGGRLFKVAGDVSYAGSWTLTFLNTQDHQLRKEFEEWVAFMDNFESNSRKVTDGGSHDDYMTQTAKIHQLDTSDNSTMAEYQFYNMFPINIGEVELSSESTDTITEFTVEFAYSHYERIV